jgi:hypothetical protein
MIASRHDLAQWALIILRVETQLAASAWRRFRYADVVTAALDCTGEHNSDPDIVTS